MLGGKRIPGMLDISTIKEQEQEGQHNTSAGEEKEHLLPAPETLPTQDQQCGESDIDEQADDANPPLGRNAEDGEGCQEVAAQIDPAILPGGRPDSGQRNG